MNKNKKLRVGMKGEFEGLYIAHWEVPRFVIPTGPKLLGISWGIESCELKYGDGVEVPWFQKWGGEAPPDWKNRGGLRFDVRLEGEIVQEGRFGHMGWCRWRLLVTRFIEVKERAS